MSEEKFDSVKYRNDFNRQKYDRTNLMLPKSDPEINLDAVRAAAAQAGQSVNAFLQDAIREKIRSCTKK